MKKPIYYYQNVPHFDNYRIGPSCPHCPPPPRPIPPRPPRGKVSIIGRTVLSVRYVDCHGHVQTFDIRENETYEIKAVSQTKGICTFAARVIDFECSKGIEKLIDKPHIINVTAIIVDYSDAYESKLMRIGIDNIISIKPVNCFDGIVPSEEYDYLPPPMIPDEIKPCGCPEEYNIYDPFIDSNGG